MPHEPEGPVTPPAHDGPPPPEHDTTHTEISEDEEPVTTGTLFIMILFLMAIAGMWGIMYLTLLNL